jgi:hypothetical protein
MQKLQQLQVLSRKTSTNQHKLDEIKIICNNLDTSEKLLRNKIVAKRQELESFNQDFVNILDIYTQIINNVVQNNSLEQIVNNV